MSAGYCAGLEVNPDISGLGVRVAIYLQSFTQFIFSQLSRDRAAVDSQWSLIGLGTALTIAGLYTGIQKQITFLDALIMTNVIILPEMLQGFEGAGIFYTRPVYLWDDYHTVPSLFPWGPLLPIFEWLRSGSATAFALYVWITAPNFGSTPECNAETKWIIFFKAVDAMKTARIINLIIWLINGLVFLLRTWWTFKNMLVHYALAITPDWERVEEMGTIMQTPQMHVARAMSRPSRKILVPSMMVLLGMIIAWTEMLLIFNNVPADINTDWNFGQILPLTIAVIEFIKLIQVVIQRLSGKRDD